MSDRPDRELDWQAFLYVTGEMSPEAAEAFEDRLAEDQEIREAVAGAARLLGNLTSVPFVVSSAMPVVKISSRHTRRFAAAATAAALLLVCWLLVRNSNSPDDTAGDSARQLVSFWAEAGSSAENGSADDGTADDESELAVPSWMLAAVESASAKATEEN